MDEFDVLVLGGGLSGASAALRAAQLGGRVCLVEKARIGSQGFQRRNALCIEELASSASTPSWVEYLSVLKAETESYSTAWQEKLDAEGVTVVEGVGELASASEVNVLKPDGGYLLIQGKSVILAQGSKPRFPATLPYEAGVVIGIDEVAKLPTLPEKVMLIGGGAIGIEAALGLQKRGCKVFLCCEQNELLPEMDEEFNVEIERQLKEKKIKLLVGKKLISFYKKQEELEITLETGIKFSVQQIIIAGDRLGPEASVEMEKLGIRLGEHQKIFVDESMLTSLPGVYAVGSITGSLTSDTLSQEQGRIAAENALGKNRKLNLEWVPQTVRLSPVVSYVGCSMKTAGHQGFHPVSGVHDKETPTSKSSPELKYREKFKIVADKRSRLVVGVQIISHSSAEWIPMFFLLIKKGVTVANLANANHSEGTKIKGLCEAARNCLRALKGP